MAIAAYLRVSTERQDLDNQRFAVGEYCNAHGLTLGDVVTDTKSGKLSWRDRDLASLVERLAPGDILVTPELSRLSRSLQDVFSFLAETARRQIIVRIIKGNFVIDGSLQSTVLVTAFGLAAEIEREFISQRTKEALARKKRAGQTLGRPVGRKNAKTKLSGHEETINNYLKLGLSAPAIAKMVKVHPETIRRYARNESPARD
jgi:DNA invertase Pin-like site-specific DNA recombinase